MPLIQDADARALADRFHTTLSGPVTIDLFVERPPTSDVPGYEPCEPCLDANAIVHELAALSDRIVVRVHDLAMNRELAASLAIEQAPTLVLRGAARGEVRFLGAPTGYELASLVTAVEAVSCGVTPLAARTREALASLPGTATVRVFVTPTCPYCPRAAAVAHQLAVESEHILAEVIQVNEFPEMGRRYHVHSVPKIVINDSIEFVGAQPEAAFVDALVRAAAGDAARVE